MSREYDYLIVGAGLFGAVFAREMTDAGKRCLVIDRRDHVAGNACTETVEGIAVHRYGAHIFHTNDDTVWSYVNRFARFNRFTNSPIANYKGELYNLPFNMNTFHQMWGVTTPAQARAEIRRQQEASGGEPQNLEEQAIRLVGRDIYEKLIKGYTQKQWGRPCTELPSFIIRRLPVRFTYDNNYFNAYHQGIPEDGYTALVERMLEGIPVHLHTDFLPRREELSALAGGGKARPGYPCAVPLPRRAACVRGSGDPPADRCSSYRNAPLFSHIASPDSKSADCLSQNP